jgi:PAS domain S-box-containing protein
MTDMEGARILFVADPPADWVAARTALAAADGLAVTTARTTTEAAGADVDCVVLTHDGTTDGVADVAAVRTARPDLPVVLLADGDEGLIASRAIEAGVSAFVPASSPRAHSLLVERVRTASSDASESSTGREADGDGPGSDGDAVVARDGGAVSMPIEEFGIREELRLKSRAMDEAPVGITITDPDREDNPMIYINDAFSRLTGYDKADVVGRNCRFLQGEESDPDAIEEMREAIDAGETVSVELANYRAGGEKFWNKVDIAPVRGDDGTVENFVGFQTDVTDRTEAEMAARRRKEELEHVLVRINGLLQDVTSDLVRAGTRAEIERAVCDRVTSEATYEFGWVGVPDYATESLVASASAGAWEPTPESLSDERAAADTGPTVAAYETGELQVRRDPAAVSIPVEDAAGLDGDPLAGVVAIPLGYGDTTYGVLTLYTTDDEALNEHELVVLAALGRMTGTNINALERGRMLGSDTATELVLETTDPDLFVVALSRETGCFLEFEGSVYREDGTVLMLFTTDADPDAVNDVADGFPAIKHLEPIHDYGDASLWEVGMADASLTGALAERGATLRSISVAEGAAEITIELPTENETREIVALVRDRYPETSIAAHRQRERSPRSRRGFVADLEESLTDRQLTALRKAHVSGYYEWSRSVTGDDLADSMGIDRSTYHQHLRAAERKLVEAFFERSAGPGRE